MPAESLEQQIAKANRAALLLEDELLNEALEGLKAQLTAHVFETKDPRDRDRTVDLVNALGRLKGALVTYVSNGHLARRQLEELINGTREKRFGIV